MRTASVARFPAGPARLLQPGRSCRLTVGALDSLGFGIDRLDSVRHGIDDIREYQRNDVRFLNQF